jgi:hypothetical protein
MQGRVLESIMSNKVLIVPIIAWCAAQALKVIISSVRARRLKLFSFTTMGGMPSSHTALVCALATTVALVHGVGSTVFAIATFFALIVML